MKRCPTCNRTYTDDTQSFCLTDGAPLVRDTGGRFDSQATLVSPGNMTAPQQSHSTSPLYGNQPQPSGWTQPTAQQFAQQSAKKRSALPWVLGGVAVLLLGIIGLGAIAALVMFSSGSSRRAVDPPTRNNSNRKSNSNSKANDNGYSDSNNSNDASTNRSAGDYADRVGRYTGDATNTTNDPPPTGSVVVNIVSVNSETNRVEAKVSFSNGLCGSGTSYGVIDKNGEMSLLGTLTSSASSECSSSSWVMTTRCTFTDSDTLSCTYRLASSTLTPELGKFEVTKQ